MKKPWAGRFRERTARALEDFGESVSFDQRLWPYDIRGSIAHARMLGAQGIISKSDSRKIIKGLRQIETEILSGAFQFKRELEDVHMNIEARLREIAGDAGARLHTARSRNDQVALDFRMYLRDQCEAVAGAIARLQRGLLKQAGENTDTIMPGYTHMQRAQPVLLGHHLLAYVEMLDRDRGRLMDARARMDELPLGACALAGTTLNIDRESVARELGFSRLSRNSMDAVSSRDFALEFLSAASIVMVNLSRMSEELVLWATEEFRFIEIADAYATGSSIMPQKKNPDIPELVRGKAGRVVGSLVALLTLMKGLPLSYNRDMQEDKPPVFDTVDTLHACLGILAELMANVTFNRQRMMEAASGGGFLTATDLAEYLVSKGVPFRDAHEITGRAVAWCIERGRGITDLSLEELRGFSGAFGPDAVGAFTADNSVRRRISEGGANPDSVLREVKRMSRRLGRG